MDDHNDYGHPKKTVNHRPHTLNQCLSVPQLQRTRGDTQSLLTSLEYLLRSATIGSRHSRRSISIFDDDEENVGTETDDYGHREPRTSSSTSSAL
mmetsp:Transcript_35787/g.86368  ORF Transcript_35787/g.86368 Transcript_35787/m.86368 type:complete len:95 (+) Transcript_35787:369-653(+)